MTGFKANTKPDPYVDLDWRNRAGCSVADGDWFPSARGPKRKAEVAAAVYICVKRCPVRKQCAAYALRTRRPCGIWGGVDLGDAPQHGQTAAQQTALRAVAEGAR